MPQMKNWRPAFNNALKTIGKTADALRVANYIVLFGGRDLEGIASNRRNADGSRGEFFSKRTQFDSHYTETGILYVDWEHGSAPEDEPGADDVLGVVDWKTAKIDERGLFVERVLNRRNLYVQFLEELITEGLIGNSSEAVGAGVEKGRDGEILRWPLRRDTLTVQPMEPRMLSVNAMRALKALTQPRGAKPPGPTSQTPPTKPLTAVPAMVRPAVTTELTPAQEAEVMQALDALVDEMTSYLTGG